MRVRGVSNNGVVVTGFVETGEADHVVPMLFKLFNSCKIAGILKKDINLYIWPKHPTVMECQVISIHYNRRYAEDQHPA